MITALVLFSIDCIVFAVLAFPGFQASYLIDILFHAWVMYYLILGVLLILRTVVGSGCDLPHIAVINL